MTPWPEWIHVAGAALTVGFCAAALLGGALSPRTQPGLHAFARRAIVATLVPTALYWLAQVAGRLLGS